MAVCGERMRNNGCVLEKEAFIGYDEKKIPNRTVKQWGNSMVKQWWFSRPDWM